MKLNIIITKIIAPYPSAVLVPLHKKHLVGLIRKRFGNLRNFLGFSIENLNPVVIARKNTGKIFYQDKGLDLVRFDFRPFEKDWERLRMIAMSNRISMSKLIVLMILAWENESSVEVTTIPQKIIISQAVNFNQKATFILIKRLLL